MDYPNFFSSIVPITSAAILSIAFDWKQIFQEWNLWDDYYQKVNFTRNNYDGLFYAIDNVVDYKLNIVDHNLIKAIENSPDVIKLTLNDKTSNEAFFLVRFKTNKSNNMNYENTNINLQNIGNNVFIK